MSEFLEIAKKADTGRVWRVLDEFMDALKEARPGHSSLIALGMV